MNSAKIFIIVLATLTVVSSAQVPSNDFAADHQGHNAEFQHDPDISIKEDNADFFKEDKEIQLPIYDTDRNDIEGDSLDVQLKELENVKKFDHDFEGAKETREGAEEIKSCCPNDWIGHDKKCYRAYDYPSKTWHEAQRYCESLGTGGNLATSDYLELNSLLANFVSGGTSWLWIGLNDPDSDGYFDWVENDKTRWFSNWSSGQPDNDGGNEHCVEFNIVGTDGLWNDYDCANEQPFICQIESR